MSMSELLRSDGPPPTSILILDVKPQVDCGRFPVKRELGDTLTVSADIFKEGHDKIAAVLKVRACGDSTWFEVEMSLVENDRWSGSAQLNRIGPWEYTIEAFPDRLASWADEIQKKLGAGLDVSLELREGRAIIDDALAAAPSELSLRELLSGFDRSSSSQSEQAAFLFGDRSTAILKPHRSRAGSATLERPLRVYVDRERARYAAWYEILARSAGTTPGTS